MAGTYIQESNTFQASNYEDGFFNKVPTDTRFINQVATTFDPTTAMHGASAIKYSLPAQSGPFLYMLNDSYMTLGVRMINKDGTKIKNITDPPPTEGPAPTPRIPKIAIANNILHTLFTDCSITLNHLTVNPDSGYYAYKAFIETLVSYPPMSKETWLQNHGWYADAAHGFEGKNIDENNPGFVQRRSLFLNKSKSAFADRFVPFKGRLFLDIESHEGGILSGVEVGISLTFSSDDFRLISGEEGWAEESNVTVEVRDAKLVVPIAELHPKTWARIEGRLCGPKKEMAFMHFTKTKINVVIVPQGSNYFDGSLFPTAADLPCRITIVALQTSQVMGDRKKNPFYFRRYFKKLGFFIKRISLSINGSEVGKVLPEDATTKDDSASFYRFCMNMGIANRPYSSGITKEDFNDSCFLMVFDLTAGQKPNSDMLIPTVRSGLVKLNMVFSAPISEELTLLIHSENPSLLAMDDKRKFKASYYSSLT